eukprot:7749516-Alexandrium_andersonii.AAC.1
MQRFRPDLVESLTQGPLPSRSRLQWVMGCPADRVHEHALGVPWRVVRLEHRRIHAQTHRHASMKTHTIA